MANVFSCSNIPQRNCEDCVTDELNKVVHSGFVKRGTTITTVSDILTAELQGNAYIIRNVSGSYDGGKGSFGKGQGKQLKRLLAKAHELIFIDFSYVANCSFWADMDSQADNFDLYFFTDTKMWSVINAYLSIEATGKITDDNQTFIEAEIHVSWNKKTNPCNSDVDVDALSICQTLFNSAVLSFFNISGSTATIIAGATEEIDLVRTVTNVNARLNAGYPLSSVTVTSGTLPAGLTASYTGQFITLTGITSAVAGTYTIVLTAKNSVGIAASKTIKFVIS